MPPSFSVPLLRAALTEAAAGVSETWAALAFAHVACRQTRGFRGGIRGPDREICSDDAAVPIQGMDPKFLRNQKHAKKSQSGAEGKKPVHNKQRVSSHPVPPLFSGRAPSVLHFPGRTCAVVRPATHSFRKSEMGKSG